MVHGPAGPSQDGNVARTVVPSPGVLWTSSTPPSDSTRSRRLLRPIPQEVTSTSKPRPSSSISGEAGFPTLERDPTGGRGSVPADVRQGLPRELHHVRGRRGERGRSLAVDLDDRHDTGARPELARHLLEGLIELTVREDPGPEPEDVVPQITDRMVDILNRRFQAAGGVRVTR